MAMSGPWVVDSGDRTTFYGATDIAAILSLSRYARPIDVYREKVEKVSRFAGPRAEWGQRLEDAICDGYAAGAPDRPVERRLRRVTEVVHPVHEIIRFHPDRLTVGERGVFEAKATEFRSEYGEPGTDQVPPRVKVQVVCYMGATRREWADVGLLSGATRGLDVYRVEPNPELYETCVAAVLEFHRDHVLAGIPPAEDGSEAYDRYLAERYPRAAGLEMVATAEQILWVEQLRAAVGGVRDAETERDRVIQRIQGVMGEATALVTPYGRIAWGPGWPVPVTVYKAAAERLAAASETDLPALLKEIKDALPAGRRFTHPFRAKATKEEIAA